MKGFIRKAFAIVCVGGGLMSVGCMGGERYRNLVDPCRFERYNSTARQETIAAFAPQVVNGHILDQTIWNYHFESGSEKLHPGGMEKLDQIVRRRPEPDTRIFLATARDIIYKTDNAGKYGDEQNNLNAKRAASVQKYLAAQTASRPLQFEVLVHDPADPSIAAVSASRAVQGQRSNYSGGLTGGGGGGGGATGGSFGGGTVGSGTGAANNSSGTGQGGGNTPQGGGTSQGSGSAPR